MVAEGGSGWMGVSGTGVCGLVGSLGVGTCVCIIVIVRIAGTVISAVIGLTIFVSIEFSMLYE